MDVNVFERGCKRLPELTGGIRAAQETGGMYVGKRRNKFTLYKLKRRGVI
jgi:hypothetical protein